MAQTRMQIFTNLISTKLKSKMKQKVISFVSEFVKHQTFKSVIKMVKDEVPQLLGYEHAEVFLRDNVMHNLYCISIDNKQQEEEALELEGFEHEYLLK